MDGEIEVEVYKVWGCCSCFAVCSRAFYAVFVDYCNGGGAVGSGSGKGEEGGGEESDGSALVC